MDIEFLHLPDKQRFVALVDGHECIYQYRLTKDPNILDYHHTYVPPELRGRGLAEKLVMFALNHAREHGHKIIATCPYTLHFLELHPEYRDLLVEL